MAAVPYKNISQKVADTLAAWAGLSGVAILIEEEFGFGIPDSGKAVFIYMLARSATDEQPLAAGKITRFHVTLSLQCVGFALSLAEASALRDAVIGEVELALMANRTLNSTVDMMWLGGGDFLSARNPTSNQFLSAGEVTVICEVKAINS